MRASSKPREGLPLAQRLADAIDPCWRAVVAGIEPRDPRTLYRPTWAIVAGPESCRRVVAVISTWRVTFEDPERRGDRQVLIREVDDEDAAALALRDEVDRWLAERPDAIGVAELGLRALARITAAFPGDLWRIGLLPDEGWVSLHRGRGDWPVYVALRRRDGITRLHVDDLMIEVDGAAAIDDPRIVPGLRRLIARSERQIAARRRARDLASAASAGAEPPASGAWRIDGAELPLHLASPASAGITFVATSGRVIPVGVVSIDDDDAALLRVGAGSIGDPSASQIALADLDAARAAAAWLADAARRLCARVCPETLEVGARYRVRQRLRGVEPGVIVEYRGIVETRPRGDVYLFSAPGVEIALALDDAGDQPVIAALDEHLARTTPDVDLTPPSSPG